MNSYFFFTHVALAPDVFSLSSPQMTANLLIEVTDAAFATEGKKRGIDEISLSELERQGIAGDIARTTALDYFDGSTDHHRLSARKFVDFNVTDRPTYLADLPPTKVLENHARIWHLPDQSAPNPKID
jgi:hypothetical protein